MPPCPAERIQWLDIQWGCLPQTLRSMLGLFNGAELFIEAVPMITIFGVTTDPPQPALMWPKECCMDLWLDAWRGAGNEGWPTARTNYGSFWIFNGADLREWDPSLGRWLGGACNVSTWGERVIEDGKRYLVEE
jgi:hypothetical protein